MLNKNIVSSTSAGVAGVSLTVGLGVHYGASSNTEEAENREVVDVENQTVPVIPPSPKLEVQPNSRLPVTNARPVPPTPSPKPVIQEPSAPPYSSNFFSSSEKMKLFEEPNWINIFWNCFLWYP